MMFHRGAAARFFLLTATTIVALAGCDRPPSTSVNLPANTKKTLEIKPLTQLLPNRIAHIACDSMGNIFYTTETEGEQDIVGVVSDTGVPRSTNLTSANILAAMGETVGGKGTIEDLAAGPDDGIYFYFSGYKGPAIRAAVGVYYHRSGQINIAFTHQPLARHSGMGDSIGIARGSLVPVGKRMNLLLRHSDSWVLFAFDMKKPGREVDLHLNQPMKEIYLDADKINLCKKQYQLATGLDGNMLLMDRVGGAIWQVDPTGQAKVHTFLSGLPRDSSLPLAVGKDKLFLFIADSDPIDADVGQVAARSLPQTTYPALVQVTGNSLQAIGREDFRAPPGFSAYAMRMQTIAQTPDGNFVGYDMASGQLMKMRIVEEK